MNKRPLKSEDFLKGIKVYDMLSPESGFTETIKVIRATDVIAMRTQIRELQQRCLAYSSAIGHDIGTLEAVVGRLRSVL